MRHPWKTLLWVLLFGALGYGVYLGAYFAWMRTRVDALISDLGSGFAGKQQQAVKELKEIGPQAVKLLARALGEEQEREDPREERLDLYVDILEEITGQRLGDDADKWRAWVDSPEGQEFCRPGLPFP